MKKAVLIIFLILAIDQVLKFWIKLNFNLGHEVNVCGEWFILHFTENQGMAFGLHFGGDTGKLILSMVRIIAIVLIGIYLFRLDKKKAPFGLILSFALIFAGALGNMIDSAFYGVIFSESSYHSAAVLFPDEGGYGKFLHGKVVDMFYFPVFKGYLPEWIPIWGGDYFVFFRPVFNIADSAITVGVLMLIIFQRKFFSK